MNIADIFGIPVQVEIVGLKETVKTTVTGVEMFKKELGQGQAGDNCGTLYSIHTVCVCVFVCVCVCVCVCVYIYIVYIYVHIDTIYIYSVCVCIYTIYKYYICSMHTLKRRA